MKPKKNKNIGAIVLAGGLGTRMKSEIPKALSPLMENPMIFYTVKSLIDAGEELGANGASLDRIGIVIGHKGELVRDYVSKEKRLKKKGLSIGFAVQEKYLGTGDAAIKGLEIFKGKGAAETPGDDYLLILPADMPLVTPETFAETITFHMESGSDITVLSAEVGEPSSYGRILRDKSGKVEKIVEEKELCDYPPETAAIKEINSGVYVVGLKNFMKFAGKIKPDNRKKEYYLTDIVELFYRAGLKTSCYKSGRPSELAGVNSRYDLMNASKAMQKNIIKNLAEKGVSFISDENVYIGSNVDIGENSMIYPGVFLSGKTRIMKNVVIESGCVVKDSVLEEGALVKSYSVIEESDIGKMATVGPFARLRPGTAVQEGAKIGNFVEVKNSIIGRHVKASHLSYIGDATVGDEANIGAGVITCNYDGYKKYRTVIGEGCFIGSDSQLVAPVNIGREAYVASGTTVTKDVPEGALAVSRVPQKNVAGWVKTRKEKKAKTGNNANAAGKYNEGGN